MESLKVYSDEIDWYIASSYADLEKCVEEHNGHTYEEMFGEPAESFFKVIDSEEVFKMNFPDASLSEAVQDSPESAVQVFSDAVNHPMMEATFGAWVAKKGRGFLASVEY